MIGTGGNSGKIPLALVLALLFPLPLLAEQVVTLATRTGVTQSYLQLFPTYATPQKLAVLFPGGNGVIGLSVVDGQAKLAIGGNFLVRTRTMMRDANIAVAVIDAPSDKQANGMSDTFRGSAEHATDVRAVIADMALRFPGIEVYLVGTSNGTMSAARLGAMLGTAVRGVVLTSPVTQGSDAFNPALSAFDYRAIAASVLMVGNADDGCPVTPYAATLQVSQQYGFPMITVRGGLPPTSLVCDAYAYHGFYGKEAETLSAIKGWMMGRSYATDIPAALNTGAYALTPASIDFASQPVGALAAGKAITLTNTGVSALAIASIVASGDFAASDDCGYSLGAGASCRIAVSVVPTATGARTGAVTVNADSATNPQTVALTATGVAPAAALLPLAKGWNLVGNGNDAPLAVAGAFADVYRVISVWKWVASKSQWAFFSPLYADGGAAYAASRGYDALTGIGGGEGYWVDARVAFSTQTPPGAAVSAAAFGPAANKALARGWNLISSGETANPSQFNAALASDLISLWAWDTASSGWYFYAPVPDRNGTLPGFISSNAYLDFQARGKTLGAGTGFWVHAP